MGGGGEGLDVHDIRGIMRAAHGRGASLSLVMFKFLSWKVDAHMILLLSHCTAFMYTPYIILYRPNILQRKYGQSFKTPDGEAKYNTQRLNQSHEQENRKRR